MTDNDKQGDGRPSSSPSPPVVVLTGLGALITILGLFAAGDLAVVIVGLAAVAAAGLFHVWSSRR